MSRGGYCSKPSLGGSRILLSAPSLPTLRLRLNYPPLPALSRTPPCILSLSLSREKGREKKRASLEKPTARVHALPISLNAPHLKEHGLRLWPFIHSGRGKRKRMKGGGERTETRLDSKGSCRYPFDYSLIFNF